MGVAETEEALRAKVSEVYRNYCYGTRPSTKLGLRPLLHSGEQRVYTTLLPSVHLALPVQQLILPPRWQTWTRPVQPRSLVLPPPNSPSKVAEQPEVVEKEADTTKGVAPDATKPPAIP